MELFARIAAVVSMAFHWMTAPPIKAPFDHQVPLSVSQSMSESENAEPIIGGGPVFPAPGDGPMTAQFTCNYTKMGTEWTRCSSAANRGCWLRHENGTEYNITTDYEHLKPTGILREYELETVDSWVNADGLRFSNAKLFNDAFPGPLIQACWGDTISVKVTNKMKYNGTSIHWHGIRQLNTMHMDGVNGITQCPIAPGDSFTYTFETWQYGSTWYHSHYSVQYADGLQGPLVIHGPKSANFDEAVAPLLMTDWGHNSAFNAIHSELEDPSLLLNGTGNVTRFLGKPAYLPIKPTYEIDFDSTPEPQITVEDVTSPDGVKRYLLRLINTSFGATFIFSIDNHWLQVVSADLVPIHPYYTTSVAIGIGQRYNVIVEAQPKSHQPDGAPAPNIPEDRNFWIRNWVAYKCGTTAGIQNYERVGILRYNKKDKEDPTSEAWSVPKRCSDEPYGNLQPMLPWAVGQPAGEDPRKQLKTFGVNLTEEIKFPLFPLARFSLKPNQEGPFVPLQVQYSDPIFLHLDNRFKDTWPGQWVVIPEDCDEDDWIYLVIAGEKDSGLTTGAHPIHLHGHDFAILQQVEDDDFNITKFQPMLNNPPRRDVVLLPRNGWVVIAFKADNPGSWLMHCHIARHASEGLGLQVLERRKAASKQWPPKDDAILKARETCKRWADWYGNCTNYWPGVDKDTGINPACHNQYFSFQDDSGI